MNRRSAIIGAASLVASRPAFGWQKHRTATANRRYFEFTLVHLYVSGFNTGWAGFGICGATASLTNAGQWNSAASQIAEAEICGFVMGNDTFGGAVGGPIGYPTNIAGPALSANPGNVFAMAVNVTSKLAWLRNVTASAQWFGDGTIGADPATDAFGFDYSGVITGAIYSFGGVTQRDDTNYGSGTLNLGGSAFTGTPPTDYLAWGASDTLNSADKSGSITLSGGDLTYSSVGAGDLLVVGQLARSVGTH